jgi:DNA-binding CsgD family transcriptional regulator
LERQQRSRDGHTMPTSVLTLQEVKAVWHRFISCDAASSADSAKETFLELAANPAHPAYGWAALVCGREATYREAVSEAEGYLLAAVGSFVYSGDHYGRVLAEAHLALTAAYRLDLEAALKFALVPWSSSISFSDDDTLALHSIAAYVYWCRDDCHSSLLHSVQALGIADKIGNPRRRVMLLSNISTALADFEQDRLAARVANEAYQLASTLREPTPQIGLTCLINVVFSNSIAGDFNIAERAANELASKITPDSPAAWMSYMALCVFYFRKGDAAKARAQWELQRLATARSRNEISSVKLLVTEAIVCELEGQYARATEVALRVIDAPRRIMSHMLYREVGACLSRCYAAVGRSSESSRWKRFVAEHMPASPLGAIFTSQIEASLRQDIPNPLTPQELECLSLSARGQTSADIGLKLGIKPRTVNFHMSKILRKLHAMNRQEAIAKAITANYLRM